MTEDQTPGTGPDEVERRDYAALVDSLADTLDLRGGLAEAVDIAGYTAMSSQIANLLNLEAGLQSALAAHRGIGQPQKLGATTSVADLLLRAGAGDPAARDKIVRRSRVPVAEFCAELRRLQQGRGLDRSALARRLGYSRSQLYAILDGQISRPPEWDRLVEPLVRACTGNDERAVAVWRRQYEVLLEVYHALRN